MIRAARLLSAPFRLARQMRSQGVGPVVSFIAITLRRRGALDAVRLGLADRPYRQQVAEVDLAQPSPPSARRRSRVVRVLSAPFRLARAGRTHGAGPVVSFLLLTLRRRGLVGALTLGLADRRAGEAAGVDDDAPEPPVSSPSRRREPQDLDKEHGLDDASWAVWRSWVGATPPSADPYDDAFADAALSFVILQDAKADPNDLARTRSAISRLSSTRAAGPEDPDPPWTVFLRAGDVPSTELARELARATRSGIAEVVTFDLLRRQAGRVFPILAPGANPTLLAAVDYTFGRFALRGVALPGGADLATLDPRRAVLDWLAAQPPMQARGRWRHVGRPVIEVNLSRLEIDAARAGALEAGRRPPQSARQAASVVICTRDKGHLTRQLVRSLLAAPAAEVAEVIVVANGTANPYALATLDDIAELPRVRVLWRDEPFNFSRLCNAAVRESRGDGPLLFLNDDLAPVSEGWIARLMAHLDTPEVGAVGALLLYPDETVQHGGMYLGFNGCAGHVLRGATLPEEDYLFTAVAPREVSCVTGAVLLVRREAFEAIGGFDDQLATYLQDVDLCLRLRRSGWINVFEPAAVLIHMESASIRELDRTSAFHRQRAAENVRFTERWGAALTSDPYHARGFDVQDEALRRLVGPETHG